MAKRQKDQTIQWPKDRTTDNTMAKRQKDRQYNDQKTEGQTIQCSKDRRTDNTMSKRQKDREYNGQMKKDKNTNDGQQNTTQKPKDLVT